MKDNTPELEKEISLTEVIVLLWSGKWIIVAAVVVSLIASGIYLSFSREKWTSTTIITLPHEGNNIVYYRSLLFLDPNPSMSISGLQQQIFSRFHDRLTALSYALSKQERPEKLSIEKLIKGDVNTLIITYQGHSADQARSKLTDYIRQTDKKIATDLLKDLRKNITSRTQQLYDSLSGQERIAMEKREQVSAKLSQALIIATDAHISIPQVQQIGSGIDSEDTLFLLGSPALKSMIQNISSRPLEFSEEYWQIRQRLLDLKMFESKKIDLKTYRFVAPPSLPFSTSGMQNPLFLLAAGLAGGLLGAGIVLGIHNLRFYRNRMNVQGKL